jgi:hypothetical protein
MGVVRADKPRQNALLKVACATGEYNRRTFPPVSRMSGGEPTCVAGFRASRMRAHDHLAAEAPEAVPLLLSSQYLESFSCGDL